VIILLSFTRALGLRIAGNQKSSVEAEKPIKRKRMAVVDVTFGV
jgi:hypothetical protein